MEKVKSSGSYVKKNVVPFDDNNKPVMETFIIFLNCRHYQLFCCTVATTM
jgi:hypothetical protein